MAIGKIKVNGKKITLEVKGKIINLVETKDDIKMDDLKDGTLVEFSQVGNRAIISKITQQVANTANLSQNNNNNSTNSLFDYPYNFVRFGEEVLRKKRENGKISGTLECSLVNHSPLFIPGAKKDNGAGHNLEYFLEENNNYIIPGSSIKGTLRTVLEAISNSCIVNIEEEKLEQRKKAGEFNDRRYGIVKRLPTKEEDGLILEADIVRVSHEALLINRDFAIKDHKGNIKVIERCHSINFNNSIYQYTSKDIDTKKVVLNDLPGVTNGGNIEGVLWISSKIFKKDKEKIFIPQKKMKAFDLENEHYKSNSFILSFEEYENINYIIKQRVEREKKEGKTFPIDKLKVGDPIIFQNDSKNSKNLAISEIPRLRYKYSPHELLDKELHSCKNIESACAACRIFGMTGEQEKDEKKKINSISKVLISDAVIPINEAKIQSEAKLIKSLGEPHPTLTSFYLNKGDYNSKSTLRGRKFYWHHKDKINKDTNSFYNFIKAEKSEKHNSSIQFMNYGNEFKFNIRFENMTEEEFGLFLYSLELEEGMLHKIGKAKALGFGSCKVEIKNIKLDNTDKYSNFLNENISNIDKSKYIQVFKETYAFDKSEQKKDLKLIMSSNNKLDFSKSPFPEIAGKTPGINTLNWFMQNKGVKLPNIQDYK